MLRSLSIDNVVLVDKLELEFGQGLSVLTGETGAGKSILLDALGLALGSRAETALIRHGQEKLQVAAAFDLEPGHPAFAILAENDIAVDEGNEILIKRTLSADGKGKISVNDTPATAKLLREIGRALVEVHGQFDNHGLLNPATHRATLDAFGGYGGLLGETAEKFNAYREAKSKRKHAEANIEKAREEEQNLRHWVDELEKIRPQVGEEEKLSQRRRELMNAEKLLESLGFAHNILSGKADIASALRQAQTAVDRANRLVEGKYGAIAEALETALLNANDAVSALIDASNAIAMDSSEQGEIDERLFALRALARKHGTEIYQLPEKLEEFHQALASLEKGEGVLDGLRRAEATTRLEFVKSANALSQARRAKAAELDKKVVAELAPLKMDKAKFATQIAELPEDNWGEHGFDAVEFTVSTNPGAPQGPIAKIASGGELARFMLALKVNLSEGSNLAAMVFDEVDSGIGGATAEAVGERLAKLAKGVQVLVVTHSPQVAAKGAHHFKVEKATQNGITTTKVKKLDKAQRQEEIARMLAGERISDEARAAAKVLLG